MPSLIDCLGRFAKLLSEADKASLLAAAEAHVKTGYGPAEAAKRSVEGHIEGVTEQLKSVFEQAKVPWPSVEKPLSPPATPPPVAPGEATPAAPAAGKVQAGGVTAPPAEPTMGQGGTVAAKAQAEPPTALVEPAAPAAAAAKVQAQVTTVARWKGKVSAEDVKAELVAELKQAVKDAPNSTDDYFGGLYVRPKAIGVPVSLSDRAIEGTKPLATWLTDRVSKHDPTPNRKTADGSRMIGEALAIKQVPKVTFEIPGDGTFTIWNTKDAIGTLLAKAEKMSTAPTAPTYYPKQGISKADKAEVARILASPEPVTPADVGRIGPGAMSVTQPAAQIAAAQRAISAGQVPPSAKPPPLVIPATASPDVNVIRKNADMTTFNKVNSGQWTFGFGRLGAAAKSAWEKMALAEFKMRADIGKDVLQTVRHPLSMLPRNLRKAGGKVFFDQLDGRDMPDIVREWSNKKGGAEVIKAAEIVKTRLEEIRATIRDVKRDSYRRSLLALDKPALEAMWQQKINATTGWQNQTKATLADGLTLNEFPDDWGITTGYLPHIFMGSWRVELLPPGSNQSAFVFRANTVAEARARIADMVRKDPSLANAPFNIDGDVVLSSDMIRLGDAKFWRLISQIKDQLGVKGAVAKDALTGVIGRKAGKQKGWGNLLERQGYKGYSNDFETMLPKYLHGFHRWKVLTELNNEVQPLIEQVAREGRPRAAIRLTDIMGQLWGTPAESTLLFDNLLRRIPGLRDRVKPLALERISRNIRSMTSGLALSTLRFFTVNRLQPLQGLYPMVGERLMVKAKLLQHSKDGRKLLDAAGVAFDPGQYAPERSLSSRATELRERVSGERSNQEIAFLAMYHHGKERGLGHPEAVNYGKLRGQLMTQFTPLVADTPPLLGGPVTATLFQFKRFPIKQAELLAQMTLEGNVSGMARWLGVMALLGGAGYFMRQAVLPSDETKKRFREYTREAVGDTGSDFLMYGLPGLVGADITGSITLGDDFYGKNVYEKAGRQLAGPAVSMTANMIQALMTEPRESVTLDQHLIDLARRIPFLKQFAELAALDPWGGFANPDFDVRTPAGQVRYRKTLKEALMGLGAFRTSAESNTALAVDAAIEISQKQRDLMNEFYVQATSPTGITDAALEKINDYNALWPEVAITPKQLKAYIHSRAKDQGKTQSERLLGNKFRRMLDKP